MEFNEKEVLRYLGYRGRPADETVRAAIRSAAEELSPLLQFRSIHREYPCHVTEEDHTAIGPLHITSRNLARHLKGCTRAILLGATLGPGPDTLLRRANITDMAKAVILQALCADAIETHCDALQAELEAQLPQGRYFRPRFSPGYGDFAFSHQGDFVRLLELDKRIGLTITDTYMLVPSKSVTAVLGITDHPFCPASKCRACGKTDCEFRKE